MSLPMTLAELRTALAGRYANLRRVAKGGQATVFKATPVAGQHSVALKVYHSGQVEERTRREIEALSGLSCPTIARLMDSGELAVGANRYSFIATQFIEGEALNEVLSRGPLSLEDVSSIGRDVAFAVEALWRHRIVHRDIKPGNILRKADGQSVVIDLGIARHMQRTSITTTGVAWGTPGYLSPEQMLAQRALTCKSDVFALGIVLQEAVLGSHPTGRRQHLLAGGGLPTASLRRDIDSLFCELVDRMVHKRAVLRPSPVEVATILQSMM